MYKITKFAFLSVIAVLVSACETDGIGPMDDGGTLTLTCYKPGPEAWGGTKASVGNDGRGSFEENDVIGVVLTSESGDIRMYRTLTFSGGRWTPEIDLSEFNGQKVNISAHYPVIQGNTDTGIADFSVPADQSTDESFSAADLLCAGTTVSGNASSATLDFAHAMHRINVNISGTVPEDLDIRLRTLAEGEFSMTDGSITISGDTEFAMIKMHKDGDGRYSGLIIPQPMDPYRDNILTISTSAGSTTFSLPENAGTSFGPGKSFEINLRLTIESPVGPDEFAGTTQWVYGINPDKTPDFPGKEKIESYPNIDPDYPEEYPYGEWMRLDLSSSENQYLTWTKGCGWYDCNKTLSYNGDGSMCWAAAASNALHWWMNMNDEYIAEYDKEYGSRTDGYDRPSSIFTPMTDNNQQHSELFNFFKGLFKDMGNYDAGGVNWFINGDKRNLSFITDYDFPGFFHNVFKSSDEIATNNKAMNKENFNALLKDAFRNRKAILFVASGIEGAGSSSHSMCIWGAEFDEEGNASYVYFVDNNNTPFREPNLASMRRYKVIYQKSNIPELSKLYAFISRPDNEDGWKTPAYELVSISLVDLRRDIWKARYPDVVINDENWDDFDSLPE